MTHPSTRPGYEWQAVERWVDEPPKRAERGPFARDRARVLHSSALRRLAAKTQVVGPGTDDFHRNRLTHTLEVAQVGRELAGALGCDPDVVETACLAHDIGHPPFGHNGERALDEAIATAGGFEGNAQTLRLLTRLEAKTERPDGSSAGLNLTRASLDAATKYPWPRELAPSQAGLHTDGRERSDRKFGVYADDMEVFDWLRRDAPAGRTCIEAQVMDFADDVAYSVHDIEDGVVSGRIDLGGLGDPGQRRDVWLAVRDWYVPDASDDSLADALTRLSTTTGWPDRAYDESRRSQAALKNLTSELIGLFCSAVEQATHHRHSPGPLTRYAVDLVVPEDTRLEIAVLKGIAAHYVMRAEDRIAGMRRQREVMAELVSELRSRAPEVLEPAFQADFAAAPDDAARLRVVIDQVASFTDASALAWHARMTA
jgi:dGTPase